MTAVKGGLGIILEVFTSTDTTKDTRDIATSISNNPVVGADFSRREDEGEKGEEGGGEEEEEDVQEYLM